MNKSADKKYVFFDVCGTLTKNNNTESFIHFVIKKSISKLIIFYLIKNDRTKLIRILKNYSNEYLEKKALEYVTNLKKNGLFNDPIIEKLKDYKKSGFTVRLLSASIHYPIKAIAKELKVEWNASEVETKNGQCTGKLINDLLDNKNLVLSQIKNIDYKKSVFYTDNLGDKKIFPKFKSENTFFIDKNPDTDSVTKQNYIWTYFPGFYYLISRLHFNGLINIFWLRELIPISMILIIGKLDLVKLWLSYWIFYSIYEIGGLWNDTHFNNEEKPTRRISEDIKINFSFFILIRFLWLLIFYRFFPHILITLYLVCLATYYIHSSINKKYRVITLVILRLFRTFLPIYYLLENRLILKIGLIFFLVYQVPSVIYYHFFLKKNIKGKHLIMIEILIYLFSLPVVWILNKWLLILVIYLFLVRVIEIKKNLFFTAGQLSG